MLHAKLMPKEGRHIGVSGSISRGEKAGMDAVLASHSKSNAADHLTHHRLAVPPALTGDLKPVGRRGSSRASDKPSFVKTSRHKSNTSVVVPYAIIHLGNLVRCQAAAVSR